jgi:hypothetical protein
MSRLGTIVAFSTGFGLRDYLKRHKKAAWVIIALVIANELRGIAVVYAIVKAWMA